MRSGKFWKLFGFNAAFAVLEIVLFSRGLLNIGAKPVAAVLAAAVSVGVFIGVNYWLLNSSSLPMTAQSKKLRDEQDYREALESWKSQQNPFNNELDEAIRQLELFCQKQAALRALLGDQAKEPGNPFLSVSEDVRACLFSNMKKLINRMTILDLEDPSRFPMHYDFIWGVIAQNKEVLTQYDNLIIEISQIGDTAGTADLRLDHITEALRELRSGTPAQEQEKSGLFQQSIQD